MSYASILFGLLILVFREADVFSSGWKAILLEIVVGFFILASALTYNNIYKNETRIEELEEEIKKLKGEEKND